MADEWAAFRVQSPASPAEADPWAEFRAPGFKSQAAPPERAETAAGLAKAGGTGALKGAIGLAGMPGDVYDIGHAIGSWTAGKLGLPQSDGTSAIGDNPQTGIGKAYKAVTDLIPSLPRSEPIKKNVEAATGPLYKPETRGERYAETVGEFLPGMLLPGGQAAAGANIMRQAGMAGAKFARNVALPAVGSEAAGELADGSGYEPYARVAGALAGAGLPSALGRAVTPLPISAGRQAMVDALRNEGVTSLTAGQITGRTPLRYAESVLGDFPGAGGGATRTQQEGQRQFTEAAVRRTGANPGLAPEGMGAASPEVLAKNHERLSQNYKDLSARNTITFDPEFANDIRGVIREYGHTLPSMQREQLYRILQDIGQGGNTMPGRTYQNTRSMLGDTARSMREGDPYAKSLRGVKDALDKAMGRSVSPEDRALWNQTNREYAAKKTVETAVAGAGEAAAQGNISPAALRTASTTGRRGQHARGEGQFSELARAGQGIMSPLPNSGTAQRMGVTSLLSALGGAAGGIGGAGLPVAAVAGAMAPAAMGRVLMSRPIQGYLAGQTTLQRAVAALPEGDRRTAAAIAAILAQRDHPLLEAK